MSITAERLETPEKMSLPPLALNARQPVRWRRYAWGLVITLFSTAIAALMYERFDRANLVMIYLLGVTFAGLRLGRGPSVLTAILGVAAFDFFFVPPRFNFAVGDVQYLVTFAVMLSVGFVIATLVASVRQQMRDAEARERKTALLYAMNRDLAAGRSTANRAAIAIRHVAEVFECKAVILLADASGRLRYPRDPPLPQAFRAADLAVAQWVSDHGRRAGLGSEALAASSAAYLPLGDSERKLGVLAVLPTDARRVLLPAQRHLLERFAGQIGIALERARLAEDAEAARVSHERETLRNTLLASISHDFRTPLAVMAGAGSTLAERGKVLDEATRESLARSIERKAREMSDVVSNVLDLMRFESGQIALNRKWESLDDLVGTALNRVEEKLVAYPLELRLAPDLPPVYVDAGLIVQVFTNLFDNAAKYTASGTRICVAGVSDDAFLSVTVDDDGPGLPSGDPTRFFDKFQRGGEEGTVAGLGLGLAICRAIVHAHGGAISARNREGGGAHFELTLPTKGPGT